MDVEETKTALREGRLALTDEIIATLHNAGEHDFLNDSYPTQYEDWSWKDAGDRHVDNLSPAEGHEHDSEA